MTLQRQAAKNNPFKAANTVNEVAFTIGAETGGNTRNVAIQLQDANGQDIQERASVFAYLSDDAEGDDIVATAPSGGVAIGTDGLAIPLVANKAFQLVSEVDGDIDINIIEASADTFYVNVVMPDGSIKTSGAITFV